MTAIAPASATLGPVRQTYATRESFPPVARAYTQVSQVVKEMGLLRRAPWFYSLVAAAIAVGFGGAITGFILLGDSWFQLLIAAALGVIFTQVAFLSHEAAHRQILASGPANDRLARILAGSIGMSYSWWDHKHSRHHANPNRVGKDPDIEVDTISFLDADAAEARGLRRLITRRQGWLFFPLLTLEGLALHIGAVQTVVGDRTLKHRRTEAALLTVRLLGWPALVLALLGFGLGAAFLAVQLMVFGVYMGASFAPNHKGMPLVPRDTRIDFLSRQVLTSRNIRGGRWVDWLMGGLNLQIEHHLFPSMPSSNLRRAQPLVRDYCAVHGLPYTEAGLLESYGIVVRHLNRVGLGDRDPFSCPFVVENRAA